MRLSRAMLVMVLFAASSAHAEPPDVAGLRLGMTDAQVDALVKAHAPTLRVFEHRAIINDAKDTAYLSWIVADSGRSYPVGPADSIGVHYAPPPNAHQAIFLERFTGFDPQHLPLFDTVRAALIQKYGAPTYEEEGIGDTELLWVFDAGGQPLPNRQDRKLFYRCRAYPPIAPQGRDQSALFARDKPANCGLTVYAKFGRAGLKGRPQSDLGRYAAITIVDDTIFPGLLGAAFDFARNATRREGASAAVPKF